MDTNCPEIRWSNRVPTEPGVYWSCKLPFEHSARRVATFFKPDNDHRLWCIVGTEVLPAWKLGWWWAGPIEAPPVPPWQHDFNTWMYDDDAEAERTLLRGVDGIYLVKSHGHRTFVKADNPMDANRIIEETYNEWHRRNAEELRSSGYAHTFSFVDGVPVFSKYMTIHHPDHPEHHRSPLYKPPAVSEADTLTEQAVEG